MNLRSFLKPLFAAGLLLCGYALIAMQAVPDTCQYSFTSGASQADTEKAFNEAQLSSSAVLTGVRYSTNAGSVSGVTVFMQGTDPEGISPVPVSEGGGLGYKALSEHEKVCVPDEKLAFALFGSKDPVGQTIEISGTAYTVTGVGRYTRTAGDTDAYAVWIPFASSGDITPDLVTVVSADLNEAEISAVFPGGTFTDLGKEKLRACILPGFIAALILLTLIKAGISAWLRLFGSYRARVRERSVKWYTGKTVLYSMPGGLLLLACAVLGTAVCVLLLRLFIQPVYVFTEWIPEDLVSMTSILNRFRELCAAAARPVRHMTREHAYIRFCAGLLRWGSICMTVSVLRGYIKEKLH